MCTQKYTSSSTCSTLSRRTASAPWRPSRTSSPLWTESKCAAEMRFFFYLLHHRSSKINFISIMNNLHYRNCVTSSVYAAHLATANRKASQADPSAPPSTAESGCTEGFSLLSLFFFSFLFCGVSLSFTPLQSLPPKCAFMVCVDLSPLQRQVYRAILTRNYGVLKREGTPSGQISLLSISHSHCFACLCLFFFLMLRIALPSA